MEDKGTTQSRKRKRGTEEVESGDSSDDSSSDESEDDLGELATKELDSEIFATLKAIRSKDPRVYDSDAKFYTELSDSGAPVIKATKDKPMYLQDYHRRNLLNGETGAEEAQEATITLSEQEQALKKSVVIAMHAAVDDSDSASANDAGFMVRKTREEPQEEQPVPEIDVKNADKDPETFLSNFMAARAWVPRSERQWKPFESDDEEEERRAEEFEEAYNFRFEDPEKSNEKLKFYSREGAAKHSVRRDDINPRKKQRELERAKRAEAKRQREEDKAMLRKLRIEEAEEKLKTIKRAAGLRGAALDREEWADFFNNDWNDEQWESEMQKKFGETYYAEGEDVSGEDEAHEVSVKPRKAQKAEVG